MGRFLGTNALAAVGTSYSLNFLILGFAQGSCIGFAVPLGLTIQWIYCIFAWIIIFSGKSFFTWIVLGNTASDAAAYSIEYLTVISTLFSIHGALMIFRSTLQGMGYSVSAIISGVGELLGRSIGGWLAVNVMGFAGICLANPLAWGLALCYCSVAVTYYIRKREAGAYML